MTSKFNQHGATLVVVMIVLILIIIVSTFAVKSSIMGWSVATNSQVNTLLLQNSDSALYQVENPNRLARQMAAGGMFNYFNDPNNATDQLVFCYKKGNSDFFTMANASAITSNGTTTKIGVAGFCQNDSFATGRSAVLSQVYLNKNSNSNGVFDDTPDGTDQGSSDVPSVKNNIGVTVISVLPSFANATTTQVNNCFKKRIDGTDTVQQCFDDLDIPYNVQRADYSVGGSPQQI